MQVYATDIESGGESPGGLTPLKKTSIITLPESMASVPAQPAAEGMGEKVTLLPSTSTAADASIAAARPALTRGTSSSRRLPAVFKRSPSTSKNLSQTSMRALPTIGRDTTSAAATIPCSTWLLLILVAFGAGLGGSYTGMMVWGPNHVTHDQYIAILANVTQNLPHALTDSGEALTGLSHWAHTPGLPHTCPAGLMLPSIVHSPLNAMQYLLLLLWSFLGVAIGADGPPSPTPTLSQWPARDSRCVHLLCHAHTALNCASGACNPLLSYSSSIYPPCARCSHSLHARHRVHHER